MNSKIRMMVLDAVFISIISIMALVPFLGFIQIGVYSATILTIPVIIYSLLGGFKKGLILGIAFGVLSLIVSLMQATSYFDLYFHNPAVSVLPRVLWGIICGAIGSFLKRYPKLINNQYVVGIVSFVLTFIHSVIVLSVIFLIYHKEIAQKENASVLVIIGSFFVVGCLIEALLSSILVPIIYYPLKKNYQKYINKSEI